MDIEQGIDTFGISKQFASRAYKLDDPNEREKLVNRINSGQVDMNSLAAKDRADLIPDIAKSRKMPKEKFDAFLQEVYRDIKPEDRKDFFTRFDVSKIGADHLASAKEFLTVNSGNTSALSEEDRTTNIRKNPRILKNLEDENFRSNFLGNEANLAALAEVYGESLGKEISKQGFSIEISTEIGNKFNNYSESIKNQLAKNEFSTIKAREKATNYYNNSLASSASMLKQLDVFGDNTVGREKFIYDHADQVVEFDNDQFEKHSKSIINGLGDKLDRIYKRLSSTQQKTLSTNAGEVVNQISDRQQQLQLIDAQYENYRKDEVVVKRDITLTDDEKGKKLQYIENQIKELESQAKDDQMLDRSAIAIIENMIKTIGDIAFIQNSKVLNSVGRYARSADIFEAKGARQLIEDDNFMKGLRSNEDLLVKIGNNRNIRQTIKRDMKERVTVLCDEEFKNRNKQRYDNIQKIFKQKGYTLISRVDEEDEETDEEVAGEE